MHHVSDWRSLTSRQFCTFVERLSSHEGILRTIGLSYLARESAEADDASSDSRASLHVDDVDMLKRLADEGWADFEGE